MTTDDTKDSPLKLIDFGMSKWQKSRPDKYHRKPAGAVPRSSALLMNEDVPSH